MGTLDITIDKTTTPIVIFIAGRIDTTTSPQFQEAALGVIEEGNNDVVVDLGKCTYISSAGLRVIITLQKQLIDGHLVFRNLIPEVREVLDMTGIAQVITIE